METIFDNLNYIKKTIVYLCFGLFGLYCLNQESSYQSPSFIVLAITTFSFIIPGLLNLKKFDFKLIIKNTKNINFGIKKAPKDLMLVGSIILFIELFSLLILVFSNNTSIKEGMLSLIYLGSFTLVACYITIIQSNPSNKINNYAIQK